MYTTSVLNDHFLPDTAIAVGSGAAKVEPIQFGVQRSKNPEAYDHDNFS